MCVRYHLFVFLSWCKLACSLIPGYMAVITHHRCKLEPDDEIAEEWEPFTVNWNNWANLRLNDGQTNKCNEREIIEYSSNYGLCIRAKLLTICDENVTERIEVSNLCKNKDVSHHLMMINVEEAIVVANCWAWNHRNNGGEEKEVVEERINKSRETIVVSSSLSLLSSRVDGQHNSVELVDWWVTHHLADVWDVVCTALTVIPPLCAGNITDVSDDSYHHDLA